MNEKRISKSFIARKSVSLLGIVLLAGMSSFVMAQAISQTDSQTAMLALPDSPGAVHDSAVAADNSSSSLEGFSFDRTVANTHRRRRIASHWDKVIPAKQQAQPLSGKDKLLLGIKDSFTPYSMTGWVLSASFSHLTNGQPNYGTDKGAFGERLGAAAIRDASEDIFSTSVMANVFHEDPRYYEMGRGHSIAKRALYAVTRVLITRTDGGHETVNLALLSGNLAGAALTNAYYPPLNHGAKQTMLIFGSSVGGSALGFGASEFLGDALELVHLKKTRD